MVTFEQDHEVDVLISFTSAAVFSIRASISPSAMDPAQQQMLLVMQMSLETQKRMEDLMKGQELIQKKQLTMLTQMQNKLTFIETRHMHTFMTSQENERLMKADHEQFQELTDQTEHQQDIERHILSWIENSHQKYDQETMSMCPSQFPGALQGPQNQQTD